MGIRESGRNSNIYFFKRKKKRNWAYNKNAGMIVPGNRSQENPVKERDTRSTSGLQTELLKLITYATCFHYV